MDIAEGKRGSADLCSYFLLRNLRVAAKGRTGIIATNTIAQGDTREVGLDQVTEQGWTIYRAKKSQKWPGTANVHVSLVWAGHTGGEEASYLDGDKVKAITPSLDPRSQVSGKPWRLVANEGQSFQGSNVLGEGFILEPEQARELIERDPRNRDVLFPYLNGKDLNSRPDCSPSRWVINFGSMTEEEAREYPEPFEIVEREVKPVRAKNKYSISAREYWWLYERSRPELYETIADLDRVLVIARVSSTGFPVFVETGAVISEMCVVFADERASTLTCLSSSVHNSWVIARGSSLKGDLRYTPSDCYETFPQPVPTSRMEDVGAALDTFRRDLMLSRQLGLTKLYNLVHDPAHRDAEIDRLREIHVEIDEAVKEAYGWTDLDLGHGHHETPQGVRWTIHPTVRVKVLDRLLELNFECHEEELRKGIWPPKKGKEKRAKSAKKTTSEQPSIDGGLFKPDNALF